MPIIPELIRQQASAAGKIGGPKASHADKVRAGHLGRSIWLRTLAEVATKAGDHAQARQLIEQAKEHELKAHPTKKQNEQKLNPPTYHH